LVWFEGAAKMWSWMQSENCFSSNQQHQQQQQQLQQRQFLGKLLNRAIPRKFNHFRTLLFLFIGV
jgi:hypothetical protein